MTDGWPTDASSVLLFGGSFDPPHRAHTDLARRALDLCFDDPGARLVVIPAARSPHKSTGPIAGGDDRVEMLRRAFAGDRRVAIWTEELRRAARNEPSYFIDTVRVARERLPMPAPLRFLIGADQAASFHAWRDASDIVRVADPVVMPRAPIESADALEAALGPHWDAPSRLRWRSALLDLPPMPASATEFRAGERDDHIAPAVADYIHERALYR